MVAACAATGAATAAAAAAKTPAATRTAARLMNLMSLPLPVRTDDGRRQLTATSVLRAWCQGGPQCGQAPGRVGFDGARADPQDSRDLRF